MDKSKSKCKKVLEGKNKGKLCSRNATSSGFCKIHDHSLVEDHAMSFSSNKLGIERYKELENFIKDNDKAPTSSLGQKRPASPPIERMKKSPKKQASSTPSSSLLSVGKPSRNGNSSHPETEDYISDSDSAASFPTPLNNNNEDSENSNINDRRSEIWIDVCLLSGAETVSKIVETCYPMMDGLSTGLLGNETWVKSYLHVMKTQIDITPLSPEWALIASTAFIAGTIFTKNLAIKSSRVQVRQVDDEIDSDEYIDSLQYKK